MGVFHIGILTLMICATWGLELPTRFEWSKIDYQFLKEEHRGRYTPKDNIPMGIDVYKDKLFMATPRWKATNGVPYTLSYVNLKDNSTSPKLIPYPNGEVDNIKSAISIRVDSCDRLWVLDSGEIGDPTENILPKPAIVIFDLKTNMVNSNYSLPEDQLNKDTFLDNIVVEDTNCSNSFAYLGDAFNNKIIVYSLEQSKSWIKTSNKLLFDSTQKFDPPDVEMTIKIIAMSISTSENKLYFNPISSTELYSISTEYLHNSSIVDVSNYTNKVGMRNSAETSSAHFVDPNTKVLIYSILNLKSIACWNTALTYNTSKTIYTNNKTLDYVSDIKIDEENVWILSNQMPLWKYADLPDNTVNFRVFSVPLINATKDCIPIINDYDKRSIRLSEIKTGGASMVHSALLVVFASCFLSIFQL